MTPRGRGRGRRRRVMSFLQPCLLVMLHRGEAHGYSLLNGLDEFGFNLDRLDPSLVYLALHDMEAARLVTSEWGDESQGPQRRVYRITGEGEQALTQWVADLRRTRQEIDYLLSAFEKVAHARA
ncbi:MAG: PadR family transcriptional regulator [Anaerolineae bacterium]